MDDAKEYWIFADESVQEGELFSKFFGGCIVPAHRHAEIESRLSAKKNELGFGKELKWQRVTDQRLADFRFNEKHLVKAEGTHRRGRRTIAKEKLYKHVLAQIRTLKPHFHPKISTACEPFPDGSWSMPYRHWLFKPNS